MLTCTLEPETLVRMGATCPACGSTNSKTVQVKNGDVVVRTYFECGGCGMVW